MDEGVSIVYFKDTATKRFRLQETVTTTMLMMNSRNRHRYVLYVIFLFAFFKLMVYVVREGIMEAEMARYAITNKEVDLQIMINDLSATLRKDRELMTGLRGEIYELRVLQQHSQASALSDSLGTQQKTIFQRQEKLQMILETLENLRKDHDKESDKSRQEREYGRQKLFDFIKSQQMGNHEEIPSSNNNNNNNINYESDNYVKSQFHRINKDSEDFADKVKAQLDVFRNMEHHIIQHDRKPSLISDEKNGDLRREIEAARYQAKQERMEKIEDKKRKIIDSESYDLEDLDHKAMTKVHLRTYNKLTDSEMKMYYTRESISHHNYGTHVLDIHNDRDKLMDLFPNTHNTENDRVNDQLRVRLNVQETKTIFMQSSKSDVHKLIDFDQCNVDKCRFTNDLSDLKQVDAIYMENPHFLESIENDLQIMNSSTSAIKPKITISFQIESPQAAPQLITSYTKVKLNWTASYRTDSVLNTPYERFTPFLNATGLAKHPELNYAEGKTKMAAWFASNCNAGNKRHNYVYELEKYVNVDVYGLCGISCPKNDDGEERCYDQLDNDYRFYLAFENSNCKDYVTEKVYTALK